MPITRRREMADQQGAYQFHQRLLEGVHQLQYQLLSSSVDPKG
eukprot:CAMPEP_0113517348 /NCGR_PEP_ID=MMETSP0014_2-20120614/42193_1 /TAXON_ID=2857 /ORGANISM="Nitzschia sp." /LENGTH=42 /DNA_ID=CAMNT_0000414503 /DNA_START=131 /DNA_END=259 /DNA_ORIENTATION=+ /assembly_acc=CAM_ASM_000159